MQAEVRRYGKLSASHLRQLVELVPMLDMLREGLAAQAGISSAKLRALIGGIGIHWSGLYETSITDLILHFLAVAGLGPKVKEALASDDPTQFLINDARRDDVGDWNGGTDGKFRFSDLVQVLYALDFNMQSVMLFGEYVNELVGRARDGDDMALIKAIQIDPTVVSGPTAAHRMGRAVVEGDRRFMADIRRAMAGKTGRQATYLRRFRFVMKVLHEGGALRLPGSTLEALVFELNLYQDAPGARKNRARS